MPLLNFAQSYVPLVKRTLNQVGAQPACIETLRLSQGQIAAFQFYGNLKLKVSPASPKCPWLLAEPNPDMSAPMDVDLSQWHKVALVVHPVDQGETVLVFKRKK